MLRVLKHSSYKPSILTLSIYYNPDDTVIVSFSYHRSITNICICQDNTQPYQLSWYNLEHNGHQKSLNLMLVYEVKFPVYSANHMHNETELPVHDILKRLLMLINK